MARRGAGWAATAGAALLAAGVPAAAPAQERANVPTVERRIGGVEDGVSGKEARALAETAFEITRKWRFIDADGAPEPSRAPEGAPPALHGVMSMVRQSFQPDESGRRIGLFAVRAADGAVFEGVYNVKADGRTVVGTFWREGAFNRGAVAGFLDLALVEGAEGRGSLTFVESGEKVAVVAR